MLKQYENEENYLSVASENIKKAKTRLTQFLERLYNKERINIIEWTEYIRDYIISNQRQNYILSIIEQLCNQQNTQEPEIPHKTLHYLIMFFNTEFQQAIKDKNVFYFLNASQNSFNYEYDFLFDDNKLINFIFSNPTISFIFGKRGTGKTDMSTYFMNVIHNKEPNALIITNIIMSKQYDFIINVFNDYELMKYLTIPNQQKYIFIDEAGLQFTTFNHYASTENKFIHQFLPLSRKFQTKLFFIYQTEHYANYSISEFTDLIFFKIAHDKVKVKNIVNNTTKYYSIDKSPLEFDTNAIAYFDTYIDLKKIYAELSNISFDTAQQNLNVLLHNEEIINYIHKKKQKEFKQKYPQLFP